MPHQKRKITCRNVQPLILLPITTTLLPNQPVRSKQGSDTLDFHLDMIKKIDKLLAEHQQETPPADSFVSPPVNPPVPPSPIEPRPPLNKAFPHQEIAWEATSQSPQVMIQVVPEEFKTEISFNPEFRFINSHEFTEAISSEHTSPEDRIEIIDFNALIKDDTGFHKTPEVTPMKNPKNEQDFSLFKHILIEENHPHNKIEIIDTRTLKQKTDDHVLSESEEQSEQVDNKAQLYYLNRKESNDKEQKRLEIDQSAASEDIEEQSIELKKKLVEEEKKLRQLEQEYERLARLEKKKTIHNEKKPLPHEKEKIKEHQMQRSKRDIKKQEKEQKRLKRLQIRQARIEERRRKKLEKQALKLKQKQQHLKMKGTKPQKNGKHKTHEGEKQTPTLLIDDELIKVLHMTDNLLGELPDDILNDFVESKDYKLYEKVMNKYKIK